MLVPPPSNLVSAQLAACAPEPDSGNSCRAQVLCLDNVF